MVRAMDKYYAIGTFALLATAVIALPTIFSNESSTEPIATPTPVPFHNASSTTVESFSAEPVAHKQKRSIFDFFRGRPAVVDNATQTTTTAESSEHMASEAAEHAFSTAVPASTEHVSSSEPSTVFPHFIAKRAVPESISNESSTEHVPEATKAPIVLHEGVFNANVSESSTPAAENATKFFFSFPFFHHQNDEIASNATEFPHGINSTQAPINASTVASANDSTHFFIQNDEAVSNSSESSGEHSEHYANSTVHPFASTPVHMQNDEAVSNSSESSEEGTNTTAHSATSTLVYVQNDEAESESETESAEAFDFSSTVNSTGASFELSTASSPVYIQNDEASNSTAFESHTVPSMHFNVSEAASTLAPVSEGNKHKLIEI